MSEIVHLTVAPDRESFTAHLDDSSWMVYWYDEKIRCVVRNHRWISEFVFIKSKLSEKTVEFGKLEPLANSWAKLLEKADSHPQNWKNKANERMMALYQERRNLESQKKLREKSEERILSP